MTHSIVWSTSGHFLDKKISVLLFNERMTLACQFQDFHFSLWQLLYLQEAELYMAASNQMFLNDF